MGIIRAVCISEQKGIPKHPVDRAELCAGLGIRGDAHAEGGIRQVSLLAAESVRALQERTSVALSAGIFAENILTEGICLTKLAVGDRLRIGAAEGVVSQIGKQCHKSCTIRERTGDCVMPKEGVFVRVTKSGAAEAGDEIIRIE
ncbi:MAG: MOSC domain-containing protein [Ndongobacter sp.]|nr:MOSC domain-containing protein [Ndongobacter sp.]